MSVARWTNEKLDELSRIELQNLLRNIAQYLSTGKISKSDGDDLCRRVEERLAARRKATASGSRPPRAATLEKRIAIALGAVAEELGKRYDLSIETARKMSTGAKNFKAHKLTAKNGEAKTGGAMKEGKLAIDRYISYRVADDIVSLAYILFKDEPEENGRYYLVGTDAVLAKGVPFAEALAGKANYGWSAGFTKRMNAVAFESLPPAASAYEELVSKLAPRIAP